jgi:hypothetical protein
MCRSIKQLRHPEQPPTEAEVRAAALQYVRKVSGYRAPSRANQAAFDAAVAQVAATTQQLLEQISSSSANSLRPDPSDDRNSAPRSAVQAHENEMTAATNNAYRRRKDRT